MGPILAIWGNSWPVKILSLLESYTCIDVRKTMEDLNNSENLKKHKICHVVHPDGWDTFEKWRAQHSSNEQKEILGRTIKYATNSSINQFSQDLQKVFAGLLRTCIYDLLNERINQEKSKHQIELNSRDDLLHMAVHDLRSPLSAMICYSELLMDGVLDAIPGTPENPLQIIHQNCQFLIDLITDFLDSAQLEAGKTTMPLARTNLSNLLKKVARSLGGLAKVKEIRVELELSEIPEVFINEQKMERVLINLLANAIKFTKSGGQIWLRALTQNNRVVIAIQDSGPGIPKEDLNAIFEKFNIGQKSLILGKGHGLGLAIAKKFVEMHGGEVFVESVRHKGSTFIIHLPVEKRLMDTVKSEGGLLVLDALQSLDLKSIEKNLGVPCERADSFSSLLWALKNGSYRAILLTPEHFFTSIHKRLVQAFDQSTDIQLTCFAMVPLCYETEFTPLISLFGVKAVPESSDSSLFIAKIREFLQPERRSRP